MVMKDMKMPGKHLKMSFSIIRLESLLEASHLRCPWQCLWD